MSEYVSVEDQERVRHVILDRAEKRNAINAAMVLELREAVGEAADAQEVHCVVLRGAGPAFSAGIDIFELGSLSGTHNLRPFSTARSSCLRILPSPESSFSWLTSRTTTSYPDWADTCAIPCPMRPQPTTPTFLISM